MSKLQVKNHAKGVMPCAYGELKYQSFGLDRKKQVIRLAFYGAPSGTRTLDPLIKSQLLYQLS